MPQSPDQLESVFDAYHGLVFRTAYRITGNAADAEDVLQTVFLRLLRRDSTNAPLQNPESYLRRAAIHVSLDSVRASRQMPDVSIHDVAEPAAQSEPRELRTGLIRALARLSPREAEVFALRFFDNQSNKEIAQALGISQIHVAVILHRARRQIRSELEMVRSAEQQRGKRFGGGLEEKGNRSKATTEGLK
ncbi:MAG TPA: sigma-70 family RNA polymerase sigma factor [Bryobacteraceae bacterium]|nr:sigma-70 family RNA polymerase sigma factor [Bryobacteraceae bacterium]